MTEPRWYCLSREGMATLCIDKADAEMTAINADELYRRAGPHRAVQLVEAAPQPQQAAPVAVPMCSEQAVLHALTMARSETHKQGDAALWQAFGRAMWRQFNAMLAATPPQKAPAPQLVALTNADVVEAWRTTEAARSDYGWTSCEWFQAGVRFAQRFYGITQPSQQERT